MDLLNSGRELLGAASFFARLPFFLRRPLSAGVARQMLRKRFECRESDFRNFLRSVIYADPDSPYLALLRLAGCEYGDFMQLVDGEGIEGSLSVLARQGVYLSIDEFKGRVPVVRGSSVLHVDPYSLCKPASPFHVMLKSGGSRSSGMKVPIDFAYVRDRSVSSCVSFDARGGLPWVHGVWGMWGRASMVILLELSAFGAYPAFWFSQLDPRAPSLSPLYRWSARAMRLGALVAGKPPPQIMHVPIDESLNIARWMADVRRDGGIPHLHTHASSAVRICEAAGAAGLDISGAQFTAASEPMTEARMHAVRRTGARAWPQYASVESGVIGLGCLDPAKVDDMHLLHDRFAAIHSEANARLPAQSLLISSLRRSAGPFIFLNISLGDQAAIETRSCGCEMERLGWHTHLHTIRSQEKLTAGGMTFLDKDVIRVLEEVLPAQFGGGPTDYQLLEEVSGDGRSRLRLLVDPALGTIDPGALKEVFLAAIGAGSDSERIMSLLWNDSDILEVERLAPMKTGAGKILHVHQQRTGT